MTRHSKSVIEMAVEAGLFESKIGPWSLSSLIVVELERFADIVREDEREKHDSIAKYALEAARRALKYLDAGRFTDASDYASDFWKAMEKLADWEAGVGTDEREKQQEPVAVMMKQPFSDTKIPIPPMIHWMNGFIPEVGTTLYTTPPTAVIAARQMRDAAVKVCDEINRYTQHQSKEAYSCALALSQAIAALSVPSSSSEDCGEVQAPMAGSDDDTDKAAELGWHLQAQIKAAVLAEREQCMYLRKEVPLNGVHSEDYENGFWDALELYESAIRSRSEK